VEGKGWPLLAENSKGGVTGIRGRRDAGGGSGLCSYKIGVSMGRNILGLARLFVNDMSIPSSSLPVVSLFWLVRLCVYTLYIVSITNGSAGS